jgi:hypothetical protein
MALVVVSNLDLEHDSRYRTSKVSFTTGSLSESERSSQEYTLDVPPIEVDLFQAWLFARFVGYES